MEMQNLEEDIRRILSEELKKSSVETKTVSTDAGNNGIFKTVDEAIAALKADVADTLTDITVE